MEAELSTVVVVGKTEVRGCGCPERATAVSVPLVLLEQLEVLNEEDSLPYHGHSDLLQVALLHKRDGANSISIDRLYDPICRHTEE